VCLMDISVLIIDNSRSITISVVCKGEIK